MVWHLGKNKETIGSIEANLQFFNIVVTSHGKMTIIRRTSTLFLIGVVQRKAILVARLRFEPGINFEGKGT
jgi:hypothetical protein